MAAEPALEPVPVCEATASGKDFTGKLIALIGRYSFREAGPRKGRWLDEDACGGKAVRLTLSSDTASRAPDRIALDETVLEKKLVAVKEHTALGKFRFGSPDYDRWAVVIGRLEQRGDSYELTYRGDGAVFFLAAN